MIYRIGKALVFPRPVNVEPDGLLCVGGDLSVDRLLLAYSNGIFPWYSFRDYKEPMWYCPQDRFVIFPDEIHVSHSMRTLMNKQTFEVSIGEDFDGVIRGCSTADGRYDGMGAWLGDDIIKAYTELHRQNLAQSVEVWQDNRLVGGLYGVTIGRCFIGESMFSLVPSASKLALIYLADFMRENGGRMIDCQFETPHLKSMGGRHISYKEYMEILNSL